MRAAGLYCQVDKLIEGIYLCVYYMLIEAFDLCVHSTNDKAIIVLYC